MTSNANFAQDYVRDQLEPAEHHLHARRRAHEEEKQSACLVAYAGQPLTTGKQAECYANDYIGLHLKTPPTARPTPTSATPERTASRGRRGRGVQRPRPRRPAEATSTAVTAQRETLFKGETLRGLLLTSFGFSVFGVKGEQVATVAFIAAGLLALLSIAGFIHAFRTPKDKAFAAPSTRTARSPTRISSPSDWLMGGPRPSGRTPLGTKAPPHDLPAARRSTPTDLRRTGDRVPCPSEPLGRAPANPRPLAQTLVLGRLRRRDRGIL